MHYDLISALHKSLRGGCVDGALYYAARMLHGGARRCSSTLARISADLAASPLRPAGEEPRYVTRRLIRFASEDVGLADPQALCQAVAADQAAHAIGMPEAAVCIAQAISPRSPPHLARPPRPARSRPAPPARSHARSRATFPSPRPRRRPIVR